LQPSPFAQAQATVLLAEHEKQNRVLLGESLRAAGCRVLLAASGPEALEAARQAKPDLSVLDWSLPLIDGRSVCRALRDDPATTAMPIVLLTASRSRSSCSQRIAAFETGADDSVTKPCNPREFVLRVESVLRRARLTANAGENFHGISGENLIVRLGALRMDRLRRLVALDGQSLMLTPKEYHLLDLLAGACGLPVSSRRLLKEVWGFSGPANQTRTLASHVARLRKKLGDHAAMIVTSHSGAYRLSALSTVGASPALCSVA
jgi:DNA-binding response OmpR family regulator